MIDKELKYIVPERFKRPYSIPKEKLEAAAMAACNKLESLAKRNGLGFPATCSNDYKYISGPNNHWECGMYTGCYWLAYELTGNEFFRDIAEKMMSTYEERFEKKIGVDDHDVGFVYIPSVIADYKITGSEKMKKLALDTCDFYYNTSYSKAGKFIIRAYGWNTFEAYRTMMDSLMNAPFLFWAAEMTGKEEYRQAAIDHCKTTADCLIRNDGSSFHHYQFDTDTSAPLYGLTFQGHTDGSCWSRGHSWGIYGFPIAYSYCHEDFLKETHRACAYFMLNHLPEDNIPYWDYDFVSGEEPRDSSAGVISSCGLLEMASMLPSDDKDKAIYESAAAQLLDAVIDNCTGDIGVDYDGLICHVTHAKPQGHGIDECAIYGDYFYLEALAKYLKPDYKRHW